MELDNFFIFKEKEILGWEIIWWNKVQQSLCCKMHSYLDP